MAIEYSSLKRLVESEGVQVAENKLTKILKESKTKLSDIGISLKGLWESIVGRVDNTLNFFHQGQGFIDTKPVQEADVKSSAFSNITGVLIANEVIAAYEQVPTIGDQLVQTPYYRTTQQGERYAGFSAHENVKDVDEGADYEELGLSDKYVTIAERKKRGGIILVTEEAIMRDQTGMLLERIRNLAERHAIAKEKDIIACVVGHKACYYPSGVVQALYAGAPYLVTTNALVDWTDVENCEVTGFSEMTDEKGEKIGWMPVRPVMLVPRALYRTGKRIVNATEVKYGADSVTIQAIGANPLSGEQIQVLTSNYVSTYTGDTTSWFYGDPKKQFRFKEYWPLQVFQLQANNTYEFERDVKFAYKTRDWGFCFAVDQKYFLKNTA